MRCRRDVARAPRRHRAASRPHRRRAPLDRELETVAKAAHVLAALRGSARHRRDVRARVRRFRARAEFPPGLDARAPPASRRRGVAGDGHRHARRHGRRRLLRRRRRRVPPLLRGRSLARPALPEDAVRQRRPRLDVPPHVGGHRPRSLSRGCRGDARLHAARARVCLAVRSHRPTTPTPRASRDDLQLDARGRRRPRLAAGRARALRARALVVRGEVEPELRRRILAERDLRPQPFRDDKALASWNGLALAALAEAGGRLEREDWLVAARARRVPARISERSRRGCSARSAAAAPAASASSTTTQTSRTD